MAISLVDTAVPMNDTGYPVARAKHIWFDDNATLQDKLDNKELGGDNSQTLTEAEYLALPEEQKLNNSYYLYDIGVHYKNGVAYSRKKPITLTMEEYKALGEVDPDQEYIVSANAEGILLEASDISYSNAVSNLPCTTVQGAIDKISETSGNVYSTEETICGTWIDGKPVYRKVIVLPSRPVIGTSWKSLGVSVPDIDIIVSVAHCDTVSGVGGTFMIVKNTSPLQGLTPISININYLILEYTKV